MMRVLLRPTSSRANVAARGASGKRRRLAAPQRTTPPVQQPSAEPHQTARTLPRSCAGGATGPEAAALRRALVAYVRRVDIQSAVALHRDATTAGVDFGRFRAARAGVRLVCPRYNEARNPMRTFDMKQPCRYDDEYNPMTTREIKIPCRYYEEHSPEHAKDDSTQTAARLSFLFSTDALR